MNSHQLIELLVTISNYDQLIELSTNYSISTNAPTVYHQPHQPQPLHQGPGLLRCTGDLDGRRSLCCDGCDLGRTGSRLRPAKVTGEWGDFYGFSMFFCWTMLISVGSLWFSMVVRWRTVISMGFLWFPMFFVEQIYWFGDFYVFLLKKTVEQKLIDFGVSIFVGFAMVIYYYHYHVVKKTCRHYYGVLFVCGDVTPWCVGSIANDKLVTIMVI